MNKVLIIAKHTWNCVFKGELFIDLSKAEINISPQQDWKY